MQSVGLVNLGADGVAGCFEAVIGYRRFLKSRIVPEQRAVYLGDGVREIGCSVNGLTRN